MRILQVQNIEDILFLDIETAPQVEELVEDSPLWDAWEYFCIQNDKEELTAKDYFDHAGLHAEFGKIVCITVGLVRNNKINLKTFYGNEKTLLEDFNKVLDLVVTNKTYLCGHMVTGFDIPFIMKRCIVHQVPLNILFDVAHLKPWEVQVLDTGTLWKGSAFKATALPLITTAVGLPSPKEGITGKDVGRAYYDGRIEEIVEYCERDVAAVINLVRVFSYKEPLEIAEKPAPPQPKTVINYLLDGGEYTKDVERMLREALLKMNLADRKRAKMILSCVASRAKGKETHVTAKDIRAL